MKSSYLGQIEHDFIKGWCTIFESFHEFLKNLLNRKGNFTVYLAKKGKFQNIASSFLIYVFDSTILQKWNKYCVSNWYNITSYLIYMGEAPKVARSS